MSLNKQINSLNKNSKEEGNVREECNVYSCNIRVLDTLYFNEKHRYTKKGKVETKHAKQLIHNRTLTLRKTKCWE